MAKTLQYKALVEPIGPLLPVLVQAVDGSISGNTITLSLLGVVKANAIIVMVVCDAAPITINYRDDKGDTYVACGEEEDGTLAIRTDVWGAFNCAGGNTNVTVDFGASVTGRVVVAEVANIVQDFHSPWFSSSEGGNVESVSATSHQCAAIGINTSPAGSIIFGIAGMESGNISSILPGANYNVVDIFYTDSIFQYRVSSAALTGETGQYSSPDSSQTVSMLVSFRSGTAGGTANPYSAAMQPQPVHQPPSPSSRFAQSDSFFSPLTVPSAPVGPTAAQIMAALQPQNPLPPPKARFIGTDGSVPFIAEPTLYVKQSLGWLMQHPEATKPRTPAQTGIYSEMVDPTLYVRQKMDWYVQQPTPILYKRPMAQTLYVQPLVPIAPLALLADTSVVSATVLVSMAVNPTILVSMAVNPDT